MTPCLAEPVDELGRVALGAKCDEARLVRLRDDLEALGRARRGSAAAISAAALEAPLGGSVERRREAGERRPADPAGVEALGAGSRHERAVRLLLGLGEIARQGDAKRLGVGYDERACHVRAAQPFLARDRVEVEDAGIDRDHARRLSPVDEDRQARLRLHALGLERVPAHPRDVRDRDQARLLGDGLDDPVLRSDNDAGAGCVRGPDEAEMLAVARHDLVLRPEVEAGRTMLQPSVVERVSATCSGATDRSAASFARTSSRMPSAREKYGSPPRPCVSVDELLREDRLHGRPRERSVRARVQVREMVEYRERRRVPRRRSAARAGLV